MSNKSLALAREAIAVYKEVGYRTYGFGYKNQGIQRAYARHLLEIVKDNYEGTLPAILVGSGASGISLCTATCLLYPKLFTFEAGHHGIRTADFLIDDYISSGNTCHALIGRVKAPRVVVIDAANAGFNFVKNKDCVERIHILQDDNWLQGYHKNDVRTKSNT
jgi:hypothetical protein